MSAPTIDSFDSDVLTIEVDGHVATLWLDRPNKRNAMGPDFWVDLPDAMAALGADPDIRAVVLAAKGPHFSVGLDLTAMPGITGSSGADGARPSVAARATHARREIVRLQASITSVADCPVPIIAAIQGWCIGGGVDLITACDIRLASNDAQFSVREARSQSWPMWAVCNGCRPSSARVMWLNWLTRARTSQPNGPWPSAWSTT